MLFRRINEGDLTGHGLPVATPVTCVLMQIIWSQTCSKNIYGHGKAAIM
jgi:hypothetical protein